MNVDVPKLFQGKQIDIAKGISIKVPLYKDVIEYGEKEYFNMVNMMCAVGSDLKWQLDDIGVDYTQVDEFELFCVYLIQGLTTDKTSILFGNDLDFSSMSFVETENSKDFYFIQHVHKEREIPITKKNNIFKRVNKKSIDVEIETIDYDIKIDRNIYENIVSVLRKMHGLTKNEELVANEKTRIALIELARDEYAINKNKEYTYPLFSIAVTLVAMEGLNRNDKDIFEMNIFAMIYLGKKRIKTKMTETLLSSGYSGFGVNLKDVPKEELDYFSKV